MATLRSGQVTTTGTPQPLSVAPIRPNSWIVRAPIANTTTIYVGDISVTTGTGYPLEPGDQLEFDLRPIAGAVYDVTPANLYVVGSGGVAAWVGFL